MIKFIIILFIAAITFLISPLFFLIVFVGILGLLFLGVLGCIYG